MSGANDNTKALIGWANDARIATLESHVSSHYVQSSSLDGAVSGLGYAKSADHPLFSDMSVYQLHDNLNVDVATLGFIKANNSAITEKAVASTVYTKSAADLLLAAKASTADLAAKLSTADLDSEILALSKYALQSELPDMSTVASSISAKADDSRVTALKGVVSDLIDVLDTLTTDYDFSSLKTAIAAI